MSGRLVGLGGRFGAGKDVVADRLVAEHGFTKVGFSDALLEASLKLDPWIPLNAHEVQFQAGLTGQFVKLSWLVDKLGYVEAKKNPVFREFLQVFGTDVGRDMIDQDVWVNLASKRIARKLAEGESIVLTGVRFQNEVEMVARLAGVNVWVERTGHELPAATGGHISECADDRHDPRSSAYVVVAARESAPPDSGGGASHLAS